ncbi:MAG: Cas10/Cmr2 second palm domain-containing protein [Spirulinaceae cyanobacterium]
MSSDATYCAITFAPVQGFIEKSRKLRDLYGSSFILSYLAATICQTAEQNSWELISPALPNITKGTPNQIILKDHVGAQRLRALDDEREREQAEATLRAAFEGAWQVLVEAVRENLETTTLTSKYTYTEWQRSWELWGNYAWEWFCVIGQPGQSITQVRQQLNETKRSRNWIGVNWQGESSTLSGMDAIAWPGMDVYSPKTDLRSKRVDSVDEYYDVLRATQRKNWTYEKLIDERERLSIPDLIKRLTTLPEIARKIQKIPQYPNVESPDKFTDLNRLEAEQYTAWFMGDGDKIGDYLKRLQNEEGVDEAVALNQLSTALTKWGNQLEGRIQATLNEHSPVPPESRMIYAGGDDFLGVIYRTDKKVKLHPTHWLPWLYQFQALWNEHRSYFAGDAGASVAPLQAGLTVSMGLVWAAPGVPQRDVLQHCREAEKSAKNQGRNRVAIRILFNSGTHLEWACPWDLLEPILNSGCNWTHFQNDIATLQARHALEVPANQANEVNKEGIVQGAIVAARILAHHLQLKSGTVLWQRLLCQDHWFNEAVPNCPGILGEGDRFTNTIDAEGHITITKAKKITEAFNNWVIALANVGVRLKDEGRRQKDENIAA